MIGRTNAVVGGGSEVQIGDVVQNAELATDNNYLRADGRMLASGDTGYDALKDIVQPAFGKFTQRTNSVTLNNLGDASFLNGKYFLFSNNFQTSNDGITWTSVYSDSTFFPQSSAYGNGTYVVAGSFYSSAQDTTLQAVVRSTDGANWSLVSYGSYLIQGRFNDIIFANGIFVAVGTNGGVYTSTNGSLWTERTSGFGTSEIFSVTYGNGVFLICGRGAKIATSVDGITWAMSILSGALTSQDLCGRFGNGQFVISQSPGVVWTSTDGATWTKHTTKSTVVNFRFYEGLFFANGYGLNGIPVSTNGLDWEYTQSPTSANDDQVVGFGGGLCFMGISGYQNIYTSPLYSKVPAYKTDAYIKIA